MLDRGTSINILSTTHETNAPQEKISADIFLLDSRKIAFLNVKFSPKDQQNQGSFCQIRCMFFQFSKKSRVDLPSPFPVPVALLNCIVKQSLWHRQIYEVKRVQKVTKFFHSNSLCSSSKFHTTAVSVKCKLHHYFPLVRLS